MRGHTKGRMPMKWVQRILAVLLILAVNIPVFIIPLVAVVPTSLVPWDNNKDHVRLNGDPAVRGPADAGIPPANKLLIAVGIVLVIFFADVLLLWLLSKIGGPLKADVKASIKKFGGSIWIGSAGLLGAFLAIAFVGFGAVYLFAR
jgi:hypothetical protein